MSDIIFISTELASGKGGISTAAENFRRGLEELGAKTKHIRTHSADAGKIKNSIIFVIGILELIKEKIFATLRKSAAPIVYLHIGPKGSLVRKAIIATISRYLGLKTFSHHHSPEFETYLNSKGPLSSLLRYICKVSTANLVLSEWWQEIYQKNSIDNVLICPNCISKIPPLHSKTYINEKTINITSVGRLIESKNFQLVISAISQLPENYELTIAGDGPYRSSLEKLVKDLKISERVSFKGWINEDERNSLYLESHMLVVPSAYDSFGMVYIEALAAGCHVITGPNPAVKSALADLVGWESCGGFTTQEVVASIKSIKKNATNSLFISDKCLQKYGSRPICTKLLKILTSSKGD